MDLVWFLSFVSLVGAYKNYGGGDYEGTIPRFIPTRTNYTYYVGELAVLECLVENLGEKKIVWRKASVPITVGSETFVDDPRIQIEHPPHTGQWNLLIKQVTYKDAGVYECQVSSKVRHLRYYVTLMVRERERVRQTSAAIGETSKGEKYDIQISGANFVNRGEVIVLTCNATGREHPPDDLDWFRNGDKLSTNFAQKIYIRKKVNLGLKTIFSRLEIKDAKLNDAGSYVCRTSDLQVTSTRINVLNTDTYNVKRDQKLKTNCHAKGGKDCGEGNAAKINRPHSRNIGMQREAGTGSDGKAGGKSRMSYGSSHASSYNRNLLSVVILQLSLLTLFFPS